MTSVWVTVEFPDIEAAQAARLSSVQISSTPVDRTDDDDAVIVYRVEIDGEPSGPCEGYFTDDECAAPSKSVR